LKRKIISTADGSKTIQIEDWNEQYHSIHGAIQEANHVFIKHGLLFFESRMSPSQAARELNILEIGFGTGLNCFLSFLKARDLGLNLSYTGVEAYPVRQEELLQLNYVELIEPEYRKEFEALHKAKWNNKASITQDFHLFKEKKFFQDIEDSNLFDLVYFDAFGARVQPELWTEELFTKRLLSSMS
jgi:tRNA U34 5-methylaminomethyl-2-thiouridine-forming methyltransferase MnmC